MYFPKPYPDEVLGSVIGRAARHFGLPPKVLVRQVLRRPSGQVSFCLPTRLEVLSQLTRTDPEELALRHTILPYVTAFMKRSERNSLLELAVTGNGPVSYSQLVTSLSRPARWLRYCPSCVSHDCDLYGEGYWHRAHLLPAVFECHIHGVALIEQQNCPTSDSRTCIGIGPAEGPGSSRSKWIVAPAVARNLAQFSRSLLNYDLSADSVWPEVYRLKALQLGYKRVSGDVASSHLSSALVAHYRAVLLHELACPIKLNDPAAWPVLMLRVGVRAPFSPVKHVLMSVFLNTTSAASPSNSYGKPGPKPRSLDALDHNFSHAVRMQWSSATAGGYRLTVRQILESIGAWATVHHRGSELPNTAAALREFRSSAQSERQVGQRPRSKGTDRPLS